MYIAEKLDDLDQLDEDSKGTDKTILNRNGGKNLLFKKCRPL